MTTIFQGLLAIFTIIFFAALTSIIVAVFIMICWNAVIPFIFGLPAISWGKAWCLSFLCQLLLKSNVTVKN